MLLTSRAVEAGWPRASLSRRLGSEGWTRVRYGVWAEPGTAVDHRLQLKAAQLLRPQLVASHRSAARLWGIETLQADPRARLEFTDPSLGSRAGMAGVRVHRIPLARADVVTWRGVRVTGPARTLADLLRSGPRDDALVCVESALSYRRVDGARRPPLVAPAALAAALEAPLVGGERAQGWWLLASRHSGSPAETIARLRMFDAGLRPEAQVEVRTPDGRRRYLDFLFRAEGLAVEIEGYAYHGTRNAHRMDIARFNQILQCPEIRSLLRFPAEVVFHRPAQMVEEIRAGLAALSARRN